VNEPTAVLKTAGATRHPSLSITIYDFGFPISDFTVKRFSCLCPKRRRLEIANRKSRASPPRSDDLEHRVRVWKLPGRELGMNLLSIDHHLERTTPGRHECERFNILLEPQKFFRQTDGLRFVVSSRAILDVDF